MTSLALLAIVGMGAGQTPHSKAEILSSVSKAAPGQSFLLGFRIKLDQGWHCYWKNPGDSGQATDISWQVPKGWKIEQLDWPVPEMLTAGGFTIYAYENESLLLFRATPPANAPKQGQVALKAKAEWLVCQEACVPARTTLAIQLPLAPQARPSVAVKMLQQAQANLPTPAKGWKIQATRQGKAIDLVLNAPDGVTVGEGTKFFAADPTTIAHSEKQELKDNVLHLVQSEYAAKPPTRLRGILVAPEGKSWPSGRAVEIDVPITTNS